MPILLHWSCLVLIGNAWINFGVICCFRSVFLSGRYSEMLVRRKI